MVLCSQKSRQFDCKLVLVRLQSQESPCVRVVLRYSLAMRSIIYLLQLLSISCSSLSVVAASIGSAANAYLSPLRLPHLSDTKANCVSGNQWVEWRGDIDHEKCREALATLKAKVPRDHGYVFWSGTIRTRPPPSMPWPWKLPGQSDSGKLFKGHKS